VASRRSGLRAIRGGRDGSGFGLRTFLGLAAAGVLLFALGAALGGPLGLQPSAPDTEGYDEMSRAMGGMAALLELPEQTTAQLTDQEGDAAGVVVIAPVTDRLGVITDALAPLPDDQRYECFWIRDGGRSSIGYMRFIPGERTEGDVSYWLGPLRDPVPIDAGQPGDQFAIWAEDQTSGPPLLYANF
jgi:hypothetical protein